jgi:SOS-response transcriptional repressor LexA
MNHRKTLGRVIAQFRKAAGRMTQQQLAERTEIDQGAISRIENGRQGVSDEQMVAIARAIGVHVSEIWAAVEEVKGVADDHATYQRAPIPLGAKAVPLIGWVQAGRWTEVAEPFAPGVAEGVVVTTSKVSKRAFALQVRGESMVNPRGEPSFPPGTTIIVEPELQADNGALIIAQVDGEPETTFKKLVTDGGRHFLVPLNPQYPTLPVDRNIRVCGIVVAVAEKQL